MTKEELIEVCELAEQGQAQFKERVTKEDQYDVACEMVAMSNYKGGKLFIGVVDKGGNLNALSHQEAQDTGNLLTTMASQHVAPSILIGIENVKVEGGLIVVATIAEGKNKPYHDTKGIIWIKNGIDKRRVFENQELAEMMSGCGSYFPDEAAVPHATVADLDEETLKKYMQKRFADTLLHRSFDVTDKTTPDEIAAVVANGHTVEDVLRNLHFIRPDGQMTVAAMLLFGRYTQRWLPVMTAKCISFAGNSVGGTVFRDKVSDEQMEGNLLHQFETIMAFLNRNLKRVQEGEEFNQQGTLEIAYKALAEFVVNALIHRSLNWNAPIRIFIFDNRVEIHSPGLLPNGLTVEDVKAGTSMPRNMFLFNNAAYLLPYTGAGTGVERALELVPEAEFVNHEGSKEFIITIKRNVAANGEESSDASSEEGNQVSNQASNGVIHYKKLTGKRLEEMGLSAKQITGVMFCSVPRKAEEILRKLGVTVQTKNRNMYVTDLVNMGLLQMTIPERPTDPNQKYVRVREIEIK